METSPANVRHSTTEVLVSEFRTRHGELHGVFRAPGRVNLIGEHTDYNDGFVMPAALGFYCYVAAGSRSDHVLHVDSIDFQESCEFRLEDKPAGPTGHWSDYVRGVAAVMASRNVPVAGTNLVIKGEVPVGSGLSSSAAVEVATAMALLGMSGIDLDRREIASICQEAEHRYAGTKCGIMDQFISCFGQAKHALLLDCRSLDFTHLLIDDRVRLVICNTMVKHELASGEYNRRRSECEQGVRFLQQFLPQVRALRDVTLQQLERHGKQMSEVTYRRCRHVISEDSRVLAAAEALKQNDLRQFGLLMNDSHESLRDDYEVSCRELDILVAAARDCRGVYGARMTGGGFGGCTVNLVQAGAVDEFRISVLRAYQRVTGLMPQIYVCAAAEGAGEISPSHP
jgi:galactokinase